MTERPARILADIRDEAAEIGAEVLAAGLAARLLGGLAIWLRCPSVRDGPFARSYADMDFAVSKSDSQPFRAILEERGYLPDKFFNGLHGATRLYYQAPQGQWSADIVIDELTMSHRLDLRGQLDGPEATISLADLLLTKLQVWEINRKDLGDTVCLLADHAVAEDNSDAARIGLTRLAAVLGSDWGFCHTVERNLGKVVELWSAEPLAGAAYDIADQVQAIHAAIEAAPKSLAWKMRSRVGERVKWYETPEEARH
jgi:hypothetical protein